MKVTLISVVVLGAAVRALVWLTHGVDVFSGDAPSPLWQADCIAALSNLDVLFAWDHARPPAAVMREILRCLLWPTIHPAYLDLLVVSLADTLAAAVVYLSLRRLFVSKNPAFAMAVVWSICVIAWEYYRSAGSYNHLNIACSALVIHAAIWRCQNSTLIADIAFAAAGTLLVLMYGPAMIFVPLLVILTAPWRGGFGSATRSVIVAASLPMFVAGGISYKNYSSFGAFSTSSFLSINLAQYGFISLGYDEPGQKLIKLLPNLSASDWWHWCFERVRSDQNQAHPFLHGLQGQCLEFDDALAVEEALKVARNLDDQPFIRSLSQDLNIAESASWAMRIGGRPMSSATEVVFNKTSRRLYLALLKDRPLSVLRTFLMANRSFFIWGPLMFDGVHHEPQLALAPSYINWSATVLGSFLILSVIGGTALLATEFVRVLSRLKGRPNVALQYTPQIPWLVYALFMAFIVTATIMNGVSCCENGRQFQSLSLVPFLLGTVLVNLVLRRVRRQAD